MNTVMIVAGESSGELYGALLANALQRMRPDLHVIGVGGERMREAGVELVSHISDAFGLIEAVSSFSKIRTAFNNSVNAIRKYHPSVLVLIDYPDFNLRLAKVAKSLGVKILYYVSPQVWAWRKGRVRKIAALVDRMAVILPFEEKIYTNAGLPCEFVGHPILEEIHAFFESETGKMSSPGVPLTSGVPASAPSPELRIHFKNVLGLAPDTPLLSVLPGSRPSELNRHLPLMIDVVRRIRDDAEMKQGKGYQICMPLAPNTDTRRYSAHLERLRREGVEIRKGETVKILAASDLAVVTSGTATLQTAFLGVPMVVVYKLSPLTYHLGKRIIRVRHISLVNILSGREVVTELIQERANPGEIVGELKRIIFEKGRREGMLRAFECIGERYSGRAASQRVAEIVIEMGELS